MTESELRVRIDEVGEADALNGVPRLAAVLINAARVRPYPYLPPGENSEGGWGEPHIYWAATIDRGDGVRLPLRRVERGACCPASYQPAPAVMRPGGEVELNLMQVLYAFEYQYAGRVELTAHYDYAAGRRWPKAWHREEPSGLMAGVPAFHLASAPFAFEVRRPLDVRLTVRGAHRAGWPALMSELFAVTLVNQSNRPIECHSPSQSGEARLYFEAQWLSPTEPPNEETGGIDRDDSAGVARTLRPGESAELLGPGEFSNGLDGPWEWPAPGVYRVRAGYTPAVPGMGPPLYSEWVEVRVE